MIFTLKNDDLIVEISSKGAELQSINYKGTDLLWNGDPSVWPKRSPVLFPVVGRVPNEQIKIEGVTYPIGLHGFTNVSEFVATTKEDEKVVLETTYNETTLKSYPYKYKLEITYSIKENKFFQEYSITNLEDKEIIYGFGLHPAFNLCTRDYEFTDHYLDFNNPNVKITQPNMTEAMNLDLEDVKILDTPDGKLNLKHELFSKGVIAVENIDTKKVSICMKDGKKLLDFEFDGFDIFAFWQAPNAPFICLEPWTSFTAIATMDENLETNRTMKYLKAKENKKYTAVVTF